MIEAIKNHYDIELLCWREPNLEHVNDTFGAAFESFRINQAPG